MDAAIRYKMSDNKDEIFKAITQGGMIAILSALVRALMPRKEPIIVTIRVFFASVSFGILIAIILVNTDYKPFYKECAVSVATAFGYSLWPVLEKMVLKWLKKGDKINDILHSDNT